MTTPSIDKSLAILKNLERKLKINLVDTQSEYSPQTSLKSSNIKDKSYKKNINQITTISAMTQSDYKQNKQDQKIIHNIMLQNQTLKGYVNYLMSMNQYLKQQLTKNHQLPTKSQTKSNNNQINLLQLQIQYLKMVNEGKDRQISNYSQKLSKITKNDRKSFNQKKIQNKQYQSNKNYDTQKSTVISSIKDRLFDNNFSLYTSKQERKSLVKKKNTSVKDKKKKQKPKHTTSYYRLCQI